ncbi:methylisocitrate lyase [Paenalcaligenes niemegkensis]|uniref:methylisocitrate lyase n=1 Tax=Paenalcaligenes niemegkensis TaxID=2895469 RepID=UPI001EE97B02|nr:methylisocitrate lyase [Paenalcaligenes niemegkensis]MCQ9615749.1 methylisocitrate lyase [Paenalcaligenes niemegkensis]
MTNNIQPVWLEQPLPKGLGAQLALQWQQKKFLSIAGAYDPIGGLIARKAGFEALYLSGGALTASLGLPDLGLITMEELVVRARSIVRATRLPLVVDGDTGFGEALNVMRLIRELEDVGVAAVQLEDQVLPKKCGHLNGKHLVTPQEMAEKIAAASRARSDLRIIARTDAAGSEGLEAAISRAKLYVEAGADAIFPEALASKEEFEAFANALDVPLLANMTEFGRTPQTSAHQFEEMGYAMAIWPVSSLRIAAKAMEEFYTELKQSGTAAQSVSKMQTRSELYDVINYFGYEALDGSIQRTIVPDAID